MPNKNFKTIAVSAGSEFFTNLKGIRTELNCSYDKAATVMYRLHQNHVAELERELEAIKEELAAERSGSQVVKSFVEHVIEEEDQSLQIAELENENARLKKNLSDAMLKIESQKLLETKLVAVQAIIDLITR